MNASFRLILPCFLFFFTPTLLADGLQDLVRPNLDVLRERAETERKEEEERLRKIEEEEKARVLEEEMRLAKIEAAKADPLIDVADLELAGEDGEIKAYTIGSGDTLGPIAAERYGSAQYFPILEHWNGVKATKIFVGQKIKAPSIATIMKVKGEKVLSRYPEEITEMLKLRQDYVELEPRLHEIDGEMSEELKVELAEMHTRAKKIHAGFLVRRPGVTNYANGLLAQCKNVVDQFGAMKDGNLGRKNSRIARVHTALAYAMRNAMIWGQEDFK